MASSYDHGYADNAVHVIAEVKNCEDLPVLSNTDIVELLNYYLLNRKATEEEIFEQLQI